MNYEKIKVFAQRCEDHPDHQNGIVTSRMVEQRLQEEIQELRDYIEQRKRKPLTDKTLWEMWVESPSDVLRFARAIEAAHGIKQPKFTKHTVETATDWSEWVCPDPESYLMKCCDCGLVHEAQFGVVRYKSETEREDCDKVNDPNLQAVFRMRRHEEAWGPEDTAHRAGGLPMEQAQPVGEVEV